MQIADDQLLLFAQLDAACRLIVIERLLDPFQDLDFLRVLLIAALHIFLGAFDPFLHALHVSQDQLQVNRLDVADRIDFAVHVRNILVLEAADHMNDGIHLADVRQELVAKTLALARTAHQSGDIDKFKCRRNRAVRNDQFGQLVESLVRHLNHADVWIDRTKRIVGGFGPRLGYRVKQCGFPHVRQTHNACF
ncbi:hypothetical protein D3C74_239360 [compost metagenome]